MKISELFKGLFDTGVTRVISVEDLLLCMGTALLLGLMIAGAYTFKSRHTKSFLATLAILPAVVCVVIMMVNGSIGAGVAVAGAFSLVRFRSAQGSAREIAALFLAMCAGLVCGMGYLGYAVLTTAILCVFSMVYTVLFAGRGRQHSKYRTLRVVIPEDLDYEGVFDDILKEYTVSSELVTVKTTNLGSLFRLTYDLEMRRPGCEKAMIDALRQRNGNLEITLSRQSAEHTEL